MQELWEKALSLVRERLDEQSYQVWLLPTKYHSFEKGILCISVPNRFFADWLQDHFMNIIHESARTVWKDCARVEYVCTSDESVPPAVVTPTAARPGRKKPASRKGRRKLKVDLNPKYTFDRFVTGSSNRFSHAAAMAVAESPGSGYNPLFIYGGVGLGKTHLMQAIGHETFGRASTASILYVSSEDFTNELINAIQTRTTQHFRDTYRTVDILLIDDIHFIAGKDSTQEALFHTFNTLHDARKQIVLSSDRHPKEIPALEERLVSRFEWGLVTDIQPPDIETRAAILQRIAQEENWNIPQDVTHYIADLIKKNIRQLEGALTKVVAFASLSDSGINLDMAKEVLADAAASATAKPLTIETIQKAVCEQFDLRLSDLKGHRRRREISLPRQIAMFLCRDLLGCSLVEIADAFGGKDHTTVLHACKRVAKEMDDNGVFLQTVNALTTSLKAT